MELKMFQFIDDSIIYFKDIETHLDNLCEDIEGYFEEMLMEEDQGVLNINSRVKSISSLKEKIIRNNYYFYILFYALFHPKIY
jgi:ppGpp synthetase/RelA/SpoT-type nucleotidyltranferase